MTSKLEEPGRKDTKDGEGDDKNDIGAGVTWTPPDGVHDADDVVGRRNATLNSDLRKTGRTDGRGE